MNYVTQERPATRTGSVPEGSNTQLQEETTHAQTKNDIALNALHASTVDDNLNATSFSDAVIRVPVRWTVCENLADTGYECPAGFAIMHRQSPSAGQIVIPLGTVRIKDHALELAYNEADDADADAMKSKEKETVVLQLMLKNVRKIRIVSSNLTRVHWTAALLILTQYYVHGYIDVMQGAPENDVRKVVLEVSIRSRSAGAGHQFFSVLLALPSHTTAMFVSLLDPRLKRGRIRSTRVPRDHPVHQIHSALCASFRVELLLAQRAGGGGGDQGGGSVTASSLKCTFARVKRDISVSAPPL
ncbi:hypothetical protein HDU93_004109 [Gonapodya sp. JEL0774]|nr:hypothetical protein HDU93_004109 [Gonapodya sp. JEL0774]